MRQRILHTAGEWARRSVRQMLSPTFLMILLAAALLWYTSKLNLPYDTEMGLDIRVDGQKYRVTAVVSGRGTAILARKLSLKKTQNFTLEELSARRSRTNVGAYTFAPASLQKAINDRMGDDFVVVSVTDAPEFVPREVENKREKEKKKDENASKSGDKSSAEKDSAKGGSTRRGKASGGKKASSK